MHFETEEYTQTWRRTLPNQALRKYTPCFSQLAGNKKFPIDDDIQTHKWKMREWEERERVREREMVAVRVKCYYNIHYRKSGAGSMEQKKRQQTQQRQNRFKKRAITRTTTNFMSNTKQRHQQQWRKQNKKNEWQQKNSNDADVFSLFSRRTSFPGIIQRNHYQEKNTNETRRRLRNELKTWCHQQFLQLLLAHSQPKPPKKKNRNVISEKT